jgi:hypothetical protein
MRNRTDGVWLPKHFSMKSRARIFFLFQRSQKETIPISAVAKLKTHSPENEPADSGHLSVAQGQLWTITTSSCASGRCERMQVGPDQELVRRHV